MTTRLVGRVGPPAAVVLGAACATSPWWSRRPRSTDAVVQALAPWAALAGFPAAAAARRRSVTVSGLALGAVGLATLRWVRGPAAADESSAAGAAGRSAADAVRVGHFNVWYDNQRPNAAGATLAALDLDVLVLSELTPKLGAAFAAAGLADRYPFRVDRSRRRADGMAMWSRHPLTELSRDPLTHERIRARVEHPSGPILVDGIHAQSPIHHARSWSSDLAVLATAASPDEPCVMVGDFNAAWTHRVFRRIMAAGWRDAHRTLGLGTRHSWRIDMRPLPPFVRLDHALINSGLDAVAIDDIDLPGSDHRGFVITVRRR